MIIINDHALTLQRDQDQIWVDGGHRGQNGFFAVDITLDLKSALGGLGGIEFR